MANFIDEEVKVDFPVPKMVQVLIDRCEQADKANDYGTYESNASHLTAVVCKNYCADGVLTKQQWQTIERRYVL